MPKVPLTAAGGPGPVHPKAIAWSRFWGPGRECAGMGRRRAQPVPHVPRASPRPLSCPWWCAPSGQGRRGGCGGGGDQYV